MTLVALTPRHRPAPLLAMLVLLLGAVALPLAPAVPAGADPAPVRLVVTAGPLGIDGVRAVVADAGGEVVTPIEPIDRVVVEVPAPAADREAELLAAGAADVEPDRTVTIADDPLDEWWEDQWGLRRARLPAAWEVTPGDAGTVVAVLDTGVDAAAAELGGRLLPGTDLVDGDDDPADENGHGTSVAAVLGAAADESGIVGSCPSCSVLPVRVLDRLGYGSAGAVAAGLVEAVDRGADVINLSATLVHSDSAIEAAIAYARRHDVLIVAAAGNQGSDAAAWPAAHPDVVGVAGYTSTGARAGTSNHGDWVDVAAAFCSPVPAEGGHRNACGTSFSAPIVAGLAALIRSDRPDTPADVLHAQITSGTATAAVAWVRHGGIVADASFGGLDAAVAAATTCPAPVAGSRPFSDVDPASVHAPNTACAAWWRFVEGRADGRFRPGAHLTRAQLASILARVVADSGRSLPPPSDRFGDDDGSVHEAAIDAMAALGVLAGTAPGVFEPHAPVTRGQVASMVARTLEHFRGEDLVAGPDAFGDDDGSVHEAAIGALARLGIVRGVAPGSYVPDAVVRRDQSATIVVLATLRLVEARQLVAPDRR